jgi:hypothetical protein
MDTSIKQIVKGLLLHRDQNELLRLCQADKHYWSILQSYLYEVDENLRWPAIEAVAKLMKMLWHEDRERVKEYIRRLLWLLNDDSGGIGWSAPEVIAEIVIRIPELLEPYANIMITNALQQQTLLSGTLWAIGRLGKKTSEAIAYSQDKVFAAFDSNDPETLGLAAWAVGEANFAPALPYLKMLRNRNKIVRIYIDGHFQEKSLGKWSSEAIDKIQR